MAANANLAAIEIGKKRTRQKRRPIWLTGISCDEAIGDWREGGHMPEHATIPTLRSFACHSTNLHSRFPRNRLQLAHPGPRILMIGTTLRTGDDFEELAVGTVSRLATLEVLHELRPGKTVTICLPLFLAGGEGDRAFARFHPTITVDGCELRCAARGTEMYSGKPTASLVVSEFAAANGLEAIDGRRNLNEAGRKAVALTAERLTLLVDEVLARPSAKTLVTISAPQSPKAPASVGCSCGSGIPVQKVLVDGQWVDLLAPPLIFANFRERGREPDVAADELLASVAVYNSIPEQSKTVYREAILREYVSFWQGGAK